MNIRSEWERSVADFRAAVEGQESHATELGAGALLLLLAIWWLTEHGSHELKKRGF